VQDIVLKLEPARVPEWEAEDLLVADLAEDAALASTDEARAMFDKITLTLPKTVVHRELVGFAASRKTPLGGAIRADGDRFAFHLVELPLNILLPPDRKLVRLRLSLHARQFPDGLTGSSVDEAEPVVAYDLFPPDTWGDHVHDLGEANVDVSQALQFVFPAVPSGALGLKLSLPIRWKTRFVLVRTSDRLSNPLEWYVKDEEITHGFTCYSIWRAPKHVGLSIDASLWGEVRGTRLFAKRLRAPFYGGEVSYLIAEATS
jgi:hypothetical protein